MAKNQNWVFWLCFSDFFASLLVEIIFETSFSLISNQIYAKTSSHFYEMKDSSILSFHKNS